MSRCAYVDSQTGAQCPWEAEANSRYCRGCERSASQERRAFEDWMQEVVVAMEAGYGLHPDDLPDCAYADWHSAGMEPEEAAREAIALCACDDSTL